MKTPLLRTLLIAGLVGTLSVSAPALFGDSSGKRKAEGQFVRPDPAPVAAASGSLKMSSQSKKGVTQHKLEIKVKGAGASDPYTVHMEDAAGSGTFVQIATLAGTSKSGKLKLDTGKGAALPFGIDDLCDLEGRAIEIRSGATVVLEGVVPSYDAGDGGKAKDDLALPPSPPNPAVSGSMQLASKPAKGDESIKIEAKKLDYAGKTYEVFMEDSPGSGTLTSVADLPAKSKGKLDIRTKKGAPLPFGVQSISDLAARAIEVRDDLGTVYLEGEVPSVAEIRVLVLDNETLDNGISTIQDVADSHAVSPSFLINDDSTTQSGNPPLQWNLLYPGDIVLLPGGSVGDEGFFALPPAKELPFKLADFVAGTVPQSALDPVAGIMPLRNHDLMSLVGGTFVAVVHDSDVSMNYGPIQGNLQGDRNGLFTFTVLDIVLAGSISESGSSTSLCDVLVRVEPSAQFSRGLEVDERDHAPDSVSLDHAQYDDGTGLLEIFGTSDFSPDAVMTVSIDGFVMGAPMLWNAAQSRYEYVITTTTDLDGLALTISTDEGGAYNGTIN